MSININIKKNSKCSSMFTAAGLKIALPDTFRRYMDSLQNCYSLTNEQSRDLIATYRYSEDEKEKKAAFDKLVLHNQPAIILLAKMTCRNISNINDYISLGNIGLINAINKYDLAHDSKAGFFTYAINCIYHTLVSNRWDYKMHGVRLTKETKELKEARKFINRYKHANGFTPPEYLLNEHIKELMPDARKRELTYDMVNLPYFLYLDTKSGIEEDEQSDREDVCCIERVSCYTSKEEGKEIVLTEMQEQYLSAVKSILSKWINEAKSEEKKNFRKDCVDLMYEYFGFRETAPKRLLFKDVALAHDMNPETLRQRIHLVVKVLRERISDYNFGKYVRDKDKMKFYHQSLNLF